MSAYYFVPVYMTRVQVQESRFRNKVSTVGGATDPSWECFVDNVSIGSKPPIGFPENNWVFCEADSLSNGQHT